VNDAHHFSSLSRGLPPKVTLSWFHLVAVLAESIPDEGESQEAQLCLQTVTG
jgi:hypothetical protein